MGNEQIAASLAFELGSAVGLVKFAYEQKPALRDQLLSRLSPDHVEMVQLYQAAINSNR